MRVFRSAIRIPGLVTGWLLVSLIRAYQWLISPLIGSHCRFHPTCSEYCVQAVRKYGPLLGAWKGFGRILRCHPWNPGGHDPP